jgi:alpha-tubulin suppressor-like RCC1 family protein
LTQVKQVAVGETGACALSDLGSISCWGEGFESRSPDATDSEICQPRPASLTRLEGFPRAERFAMTADGRSCIMTSEGGVFCQGSYYTPDTEWFRAMAPLVGRPAPIPDSGVRRLAVPQARDIVAGKEHFCSLGVDGSVTCWDENAYGQCGAPTEVCVEYVYSGCKVAPFRVALGARAIAVSAGAEHSCALLDDGGVACWGRNQNAALGFRSSEVCHPNWRGFCDSMPKRIDGVSDVVQLVASKARVQTWALTASGHVLVWPEQVRSQPSWAIGQCRQPETALPSEQIAAREPELRGQRLRVRGQVRPSGAGQRMGLILLKGGLGIPSGPEVVVDGKLMGFLSTHGDRFPLGLYVFDACLVRPSE